MLEIFQVLAWRVMSLLWESNLQGIPHHLTIFLLREAAGGCSALKWVGWEMLDLAIPPHGHLLGD